MRKKTTCVKPRLYNATKTPRDTQQKHIMLMDFIRELSSEKQEQEIS